jgi:hypothetical protein
VGDEDRKEEMEAMEEKRGDMLLAETVPWARES